MKLARAYETLKDESKRRAYDLIYPSIRRSRPTTQTPRPPPASPPQPEALSEAAQIAALEKSKQERGARWWTKKNAFDSSIFELQRGIRRLEQDIKILDSIVAAEAAKEAQKNSWGTWLLSPITKKVEESEEEKERKDRERQERRIEKDMKERRLESKKADLKKEESLLGKAKEEVDAADLVDDGKIRLIQNRKRAREYMERQERERKERERLARIRKQQQEQQEKRDREAAEALRKQQQEQQEKRDREAAKALKKQKAEEQKRREEEQKRQEELQKIVDESRNCQKRQAYLRQQYARLNQPEGSTRQAYASACGHDGWWSKVQGRTACPECFDIWTYLLQCPGCQMKACPKCQSAIRPRLKGNAARTARRDPPRVRTPSPGYWEL